MGYTIDPCSLAPSDSGPSPPLTYVCRVPPSPGRRLIRRGGKVRASQKVTLPPIVPGVNMLTGLIFEFHLLCFRYCVWLVCY
ncbi:hypothetical protein E2C01_033866 [Portunus trituberculatus]|uniref:Uncharacterized protein n=1 Tax=Portunus trituberculatus TaxID=210409 RepID=A0A5B7EZ14_PORTR|nr:hypothetical protein [Portunus trituberculatus]